MHITDILTVVCMAAFGSLLLLVLYFRVKVLRAYHVLLNNRVVFDKSHIFDRQKLEAEILPRYPQQRKEILDFVGGINFSMRCVFWLVAIVTICAAGLIFLR
jgi:hypothetical protein